MVGRMFDSMSQGRFAVTSIVDSYAMIVAGCLLIVPGFITDALGLALLVPPLRSIILGAMLPGIAGRRRVDQRATSAKPAVRAAPDRHRGDLRAPRRRGRQEALSGTRQRSKASTLSQPGPRVS